MPLQETGSSLCLVLGFENCVDFLSSAIVLWRFFAPSSLSPEVEEKLSHREKRASIAISIVLVILGLFIFGTAIADFMRGNEAVESYSAILGISFISFLAFSVLSIFKFHYAKALESASLYKDGICSLIGTVLSGALFISTLIVEKNANAWWIDPVISLLCGFASMYIGYRGVYTARVKDQLPIFSCSWWFTSSGDGMDERSGRPLGPDDFGKKGSDVELGSKGDGEGDIV